MIRGWLREQPPLFSTLSKMSFSYTKWGHKGTGTTCTKVAGKTN